MGPGGRNPGPGGRNPGPGGRSPGPGGREPGPGRPGRLAGYGRLPDSSSSGRLPDSSRSNSPSLTPRTNASHSASVKYSRSPSGLAASYITYSLSASALCGAAEVSVVTYTSTRLSSASSPGVCMRSGYRPRLSSARRGPDKVVSVPDPTSTHAEGPHAPAGSDADWYARLPTMFGSGAAIFTNQAGQVLLVKP